MARTITWSKLYVADEVLAIHTEIQNSSFNPCPFRKARISIYSKSSIAGGNMTFKIAGLEHAEDMALPIDSGSLSTQTHKVASGVMYKNDKWSVGGRETAGGAPTVVGMAIIEPMP